MKHQKISTAFRPANDFAQVVAYMKPYSLKSVPDDEPEIVLSGYVDVELTAHDKRTLDLS